MKTRIIILSAFLAIFLMGVTVFAVEYNKPSNHDLSWLNRHGPSSKANIQECVECHKDQISCNQCHQQTAPRNHTPAWTKLGHGLEARWDRGTCTTCHKEDSCTECHTRTPPSSHRPGWLGAGSGAQNRHCTGCHFPLQKTTCFVCHKTAHGPNI